MSNVTNYLSPAAIAQYELRSRQANLAAGRGLEKLATQRQYATADRQLGLEQAQRGYGMAYRSLPNAYARRNILRSGIFRTGRENQQYDYQRALQDFERRYQRQMGGFSEQQGDIELIRGMTLDQIAAERNAANAALAAQLREV